MNVSRYKDEHENSGRHEGLSLVETLLFSRCLLQEHLSLIGRLQSKVVGFLGSVRCWSNRLQNKTDHAAIEVNNAYSRRSLPPFVQFTDTRSTRTANAIMRSADRS